MCWGFPYRRRRYWLRPEWAIASWLDVEVEVKSPDLSPGGRTDPTFVPGYASSRTREKKTPCRGSRFILVFFCNRARMSIAPGTWYVGVHVFSLERFRLALFSLPTIDVFLVGSTANQLMLRRGGGQRVAAGLSRCFISRALFRSLILYLFSFSVLYRE